MSGRASGRTQVERVKLPFQVIERVNDVRRSEFGQAPLLGTEPPLEWPDRWQNKLIWGDDKYILAWLLEQGLLARPEDE